MSDADYTATRTDIEGGWLQRNWVDTLGWIAVGALTAVGIALIALTTPVWATAAGIGILVGGAFTLGSQLLAGNGIEPWQIAWGQVVGGLTGAAFAAVAPAAGAGWTIGNRAAATGVNFTSGFVSDLGSQHIHNAVNDGPDQDINLWRSLTAGTITAGTTLAGTYLGPRLTNWWQTRRSPATTAFYTVQSAEDAARLASGGTPWPTSATRAEFGTGVYAWGNADDAARYSAHLERRGALVQLCEFRLSTIGLKHVDVDSLPNPSAFMSKYSQLWGGTPTHGLDYITRGTQYGTQHYFSPDAFHSAIWLGPR